MPIALCCLLSLAFRSATRRARGVALGMGVAGGVVLVARYVARFGSEPIGYPTWEVTLWSAVDRWAPVADLLQLDRQFWLTLVLVAGAAGFWRPRVWVVAALVSVPSGLVAFRDSRRWPVPEMAWIAVVLAALGVMALCRHSVAALWGERGRSETPAS